MFYKGEVPFVRLLIPLIIGIYLGCYFAHASLLKWALIVGLILPAVFAFLLYRYKIYSLYRASWLFGLIIHSYILLSGYSLTGYSTGKFDDRHFSFQEADAFVLQIRSEPKSSNGIIRFESEALRYYFKKETGPATGKLLLTIKVDSVKSPSLNYGDILLIPAFYNEVEPPYNPGEFDYKAFLANHQIYHQAFLNPLQYIILKRDAGNPIIAFALRLRKQFVKKFYRYLPDSESAAFASTLILGYRADLSKELIEAYSKTGTMHVLSVSGMHVGIVFLVLTAVLKPMDKNEKLRLIRAFLIVLVIWFYSLLTGFSAPVCRSALMLSFVVIGKALNKSQNTYNLIAISAFFLLLYNPFYLADAGFQLSYLAVTGLVYFHPKIYHAILIRNKILDQAWSYCALSVAAQLATFPISLYYFHQFPVYFLISNLFIVLPVTIIMYAGIAFLIIPCSIVIQYLGSFLNWLIRHTNDFLYYIENLPFASLGGIWISTFQFLMIYLIMASFILIISFKIRKLLLPVSVLLCVLMISFAFKTWLDFKRHEIIFFSIRKQSAIAYVYRGESLLVADVDPSDKLFSFSIKPVLDKRGNNKLKFFHNRKSFSGDSYKGDTNFLQFANFRILRWTSDFDNLIFIERLKVNAILISGNPKSKLRDIQTAVDFSRIFIDGTNPDYKIEAWKAEAGKMNIACYVLKKNPAYIIKL